MKEKLRGTKLTIEKEGGPANRVDLTLHKGCSYSVKVTDTETGKGIANAAITFGWMDIDREYKTSQDGIAQIVGLAMDDWHFMVKAESFAIQQRKIPTQSLGSNTDLSFELEPGTILEGIVLDADGAPIPNATIDASLAESSGMSRLGKGVLFPTLAPGEYTIFLQGERQNLENGMFNHKTLERRTVIVEEDMEVEIDF